MYALLWGRDLGHGRAPDLQVPVAPTPHPLLTLIGFALSPFGGNAPALFRTLILASFALLGWAAFQLGRNLFSAQVGILFAVILLTRKLLVVETLLASQDIPFIALVLWAAALEARRPRRGAPVLALLTTAGLLRPEAWLLAGAYLAYVLPRAAFHQRLAFTGIAISAPLIWAAFDLSLTGDVLFSAHSTQALAAQLERPRHLGTGLASAPIYLKFILNAPIMYGGITGAALALYALYGRSLLPAALGALGLVAFLILAVAGLPLIVRYLVVPAAVLALFFAVAVFGWLNLSRGSIQRSLWIAAASIVALLGVFSFPRDLKGVEDAKHWAAAQRHAQSDLRDLATAPHTALWMRRCPRPIYVSSHSVVPLLSYWLEQPPDRFSATEPPLDRGLLISPANPVVAATVQLEPGLGAQPPTTFARVGGNDSWTLFARC
jgi:hypothetical protein